jgi:outer membrane protein assembly factor BamA
LLTTCLLLIGLITNGQEYHLEIRDSSTSGYIDELTSELEGSYMDSSTIHMKLRESLSDMRRRGFLAASYDSIRVREDTLTAWLHVGRQYRWGQFSLNAPDSSLFREPTIFREMKNNAVINLQELNALEEKIVTYLENRGYPFASVRIERLEHAGADTLNASLNIEPGKRYVIDSIMIQGNNPVSEKYLYPYLGLYPGMVYNESRLKQIPNRIENLAFLRQIRDFELEFSEGHRVNVFLYLERAENNQVDGVVGFLPGGDGKIRFTGQFDLSLSNLFRRGEHLAVNWNSLEKQSQEFNLQMDFPYLLLQSVGINASLDLYKKDTSFLSRTFRAGLSFYINSQSRLEVFGDFEGSSLISEAPEVKERYEPFQMRLYGVRYAFNNLDYRLNPSRGLELDLFGSLGRRRGGEDDESRTSAETGLDIVWYQPLFRSWVVKASGHGRFKYMWSEGNKGFRENELYRFGGFESLRGFDDHAFLAPVYSVVSLELRYLLSRNSNLYAFWDGGWYHRDIVSGIKEDFPFGFGVGAHIDTGGGIMYISYALGQQAENPIELGSAKIHLGYVNKF